MPTADIVSASFTEPGQPPRLTSNGMVLRGLITKHSDLPKIATGGTPDMRVVFMDPNTDPNSKPAPFELEALLGAGPCYATLYTGDLIVDGEPCESVLVLGGPPLFLAYIIQYLEATQKDHTYGFDPAEDPAAALKVADTGADIAGVKVYHFHISSVADYPDIFYSNAIDPITKLISGYHTFFPQSHGYIFSHFVPVPLPPGHGAAMPAFAHTNKHSAIIQGILALSLAYSRKDMLKNQIHQRLKAASAGCGSDLPTAEEVNQVLTSASWDVLDLPPVLVPMVATIVCEDQDGDIDPLVVVADLKPIADVIADHGLTVWGGALVEQARLVYDGYHATSIRFALAVENLLRVVFMALAGAWQDELTNLAALRVSLRGTKYAGMVSIIPDAQRVSNVSRAIYVGLKYHERCLVDTKAKEEFKQYKVEGIKAHINPPEDANMCDNIVATLPEPTIMTTVTMAKLCPAADTELLLVKHSPEEITLIFKYLSREAVPGPWYAAERDRRIAVETAKLLTETLSKLKVMEDEILVRFNEELSEENDLAAKAAKKAARDAWKAQVKQAKTGLQSLDDLVGAVTDSSLTAVKVQVIASLTPLHALVQTGI